MLVSQDEDTARRQVLFDARRYRGGMSTRTVPMAAAVLLAALLVGCAPDASETPSADSSATPSASSDPSPQPTGPVRTGPPLTPPTVTMPTDCEAILSASLLNLLSEQPLNDEAFAPTGVQPDGALICVWGDPGADTTRLATTISVERRGPALDMLNELADDEGFRCYQPDTGTRCEKTWENEDYPVTDGRTLYWRDDVLIDTRYSNLTPPGFTSDVVAHVFAGAEATPEPPATPTPTP
jgi:hypothetical protein